MEQTVYIDLFFLINFSMDFLCFYLTSRLLSHKLSVGRCALASALGGVYACAALFVSVGELFALFLDIFICVCICAVAIYRRGSGRELFGYSVVYVACSVVLGGAMTALFSLFNRLGVDRLLGDDGGGDGISVWLFAVLALISGVLSLKGIKAFRRKGSRREGRVELVYNGKRVVLRALCDSGNLLTDPVSSRPCIVAESVEVKKILPRALVDVIEKGAVGEIDKRDAGRLCIIPAKTVSGGGMLYALRMDTVRIDLGGGWLEADALIALSALGGSAEGAQALIPSALALGAP